MHLFVSLRVLRGLYTSVWVFNWFLWVLIMLFTNFLWVLVGFQGLVCLCMGSFKF